jgi:hypothetical protein
MATDPRRAVGKLEAAPTLPLGSAERMDGYGVMGLPFRSGHVLAMRRFTASSIGPAYTAVWHRFPNGEWEFFTDVAPKRSCPRYFGANARRSLETNVSLEWSGPYRVRIDVPSAALELEVTLAPTRATRFINAVAGLLPAAAWRQSAVLGAMSAIAGPMLRVGRIGLQGTVPNGQGFIANPRLMWAVTEARARLAGEDLGPPGPVEPQARLGDFWIPQRGIFAAGQAYFQPFDAGRHLARTSRSEAA